MRKLIIIGVAVAALAASLGVATATGGGNQPVEASLSGTSFENYATGPSSLGATSTGTLKHFGSATLSQTMAGPAGQSPEQPYDASGTWRLMAANGDLINGTSTGTCTRSSDFVGATCVLDMTSTDGTGRFEGASATFTATTELTRVSCDQSKPFCYGVVTTELVGHISR
jgi:hypothetical protein